MLQNYGNTAATRLQMFLFDHSELSSDSTFFELLFRHNFINHSRHIGVNINFHF